MKRGRGAPYFLLLSLFPGTCEAGGGRVDWSCRSGGAVHFMLAQTSNNIRNRLSLTFVFPFTSPLEKLLKYWRGANGGHNHHLSLRDDCGGGGGDGRLRKRFILEVSGGSRALTFSAASSTRGGSYFSSPRSSRSGLSFKSLIFCHFDEKGS